MKDTITYILAQIIMMAMLCAAIVILNSCKTMQPIPQTKDSVRIEIRHDSVFVWQHDSIFRDRWRNGDTVFVTVEKWQVKWRDRITEIHDTITANEVQVQEVKHVPVYYKRVSTGFWILLAVLVIIVGVKAVKLYLRIKSGGLIK